MTINLNKSRIKVNENILYDFMIQCYQEIHNRKRDIVLTALEGNILDHRYCNAKHDMVCNEEEKRRKLRQISFGVEAAVVDESSCSSNNKCRGNGSKSHEKYVEQIGVALRVEHLQKAAPIGTARLLRRWLGK